MPLLHSIRDPQRPAFIIDDAVAFCIYIALDFETYSGLIRFATYADAESAFTGGRRLRAVEYAITPTGTPAEYGQPPQLTAYVPPVYGEYDPETQATPIITPEVLPTFGPAPLIRAAVPSFGELVEGEIDAFAAVRLRADTIAASQPEFAGAVIVPSRFEQAA